MGVGDWSDAPRANARDPRARRFPDAAASPDRSYASGTGGARQRYVPGDRAPEGRPDPRPRGRTGNEGANGEFERRPPRPEHDPREYSSGRAPRPNGGGRDASSNRGRPPSDAYGSYDGSERPARDPRGSDGDRSGARYRDGERPADRSGTRYGSPNGERAGDRSLRTGRVPAPAGDQWEPPRRARVRPQDEVSPDEMRSRRGRGAAPLWNDDDEEHPRRGPGGSFGGGRGGSSARMAPVGVGMLDDDDENEERRGGFGFVKSLGVIVLMLVIGAAAGYGYFQYTTPKLHTTTPTSSQAPSAGAASSAAGASSAAPAATNTPHASVTTIPLYV